MLSISKAHSGLIGDKTTTTLFHRFVVAIAVQVIEFTLNPHLFIDGKMLYTVFENL